MSGCSHSDRLRRIDGREVCGTCGYLFAATPAARYSMVSDMLSPPDGSEPLISREQAVKLLGAEDLFTPPARPVRVGDTVRIARPYSHAGDREVAGIKGPSEWRLMLVKTPGADFEVSETTLERGLLTHTDGAPVDVAASLEVPPVATAHGLCRGCGAVASLFNADGVSDPSTATLCGGCHAVRNAADLTNAFDLEAARKRCDHLQALAAEAQKRSAYLAEQGGKLEAGLGRLNGELREANDLIAKQARTIERLERDAKRGRR